MASAEGSASPPTVDHLGRDHLGRLRFNLPGRLARIIAWIRAADIRIALSIAVVALILRVIWVLSVTRHGFAINDALFYDIFAQQLAKGHGYTQLHGAPSAAWPPGYPFVLSLAFRVFGTAEVVGKLLNAVIGAATVPLLYLTALRAFGRREAVFAATVLALFPAQIFLTDVLIAETLDTFLIVALFALLTVVRPTRAAAAAIGVLIGLAALTRGENLLLVLVPLVVWWSVLTPRLRALRFGIVVLGAAVVIAPWTIRNAEELHSFIPISDNIGQSLYSGHNPHANGGNTYAPASLLAKVQRERNPQREIDRNSLLTHYAEHWAIRHPAQELLLIPERFMALVGDDGSLLSIWINKSLTQQPAIGFAGTARLALLASAAWYALLAAFLATLALAGRALWRAPRTLAARAAVSGVLTWIIISVSVCCVVLFGEQRYHVPLEPLMILITAPGLCRAFSRRSMLAAQFSGRLVDGPHGGVSA